MYIVFAKIGIAACQLAIAHGITTVCIATTDEEEDFLEQCGHADVVFNAKFAIDNIKVKWVFIGCASFNNL